MVEFNPNDTPNINIYAPMREDCIFLECGKVERKNRDVSAVIDIFLEKKNRELL